MCMKYNSFKRATCGQMIHPRDANSFLGSVGMRRAANLINCWEIAAFEMIYCWPELLMAATRKALLRLSAAALAM